MISNEVSVTDKQRLTSFRKKLLGWLCVVCIIFLLGYAASPFVKIGFNGTDSIDGHVFLIVKQAMPKKGDLVAFWPPENDFYQNIWFVKYIKGEGGDEVSREGHAFFINGEYIGDAKTESNSGVALQPSQSGIIPQDKYFVWTPHADSFDSRYEAIDWISEKRFMGRAFRIL